MIASQSQPQPTSPRPARRFRHGGARPGAGRKTGARPPVPHRERPSHRAVHPLHVTLRMRDHVWNLRSKRGLRALRRAFAGGCERFGFRLVHYSLQGKHVHLIAEARDRAALARGMKGLGVRIARRLNALMGSSGPVFQGRYHARALRTPLEVRRALLYVLANFRRHHAQVGKRLPNDWLDPFSSARALDGWRAAPGLRRALAAACDPCPELAPGIRRPRTPLLATGWRRKGLLDPCAVPGPTRPPSEPARAVSRP